MAKIVGVRFRDGEKTYYFDPGNLVLRVGDFVIVETAHGTQIGKTVIPNTEKKEEEIIAPLKTVIRIATPKDMKQAETNKAKEADAFKICNEKIAKHGLDMKLISVKYSFDGSKILFYFTSSGRVDFRELVKDLAAVFKTRIELRQIGVRDEAKMLGGLGICGKSLCCATHLSDFQPVSIKMAKEQCLSLNPAKISGCCGRLMCCLKYEQDTYDELIKITPREGSIVKTPDGNGIVESVTLLTGKIRVKLDKDDENILKEFNRDELKVLKHAKAKEEPADDESLKDLE